MDFDINAFLDAPIENPLEKRTLLNPGDYIAVISDAKMGTWTSKDKLDPITGQPLAGLKVELKLELEVPEAEVVRCNLRGPKFTLSDGFILDLTETRAIDDSPGRNTKLRMYREATDQNRPGESFTIRRLVGRQVRVKLGHRAPTQAGADPIEEIRMVGRI